ncbi:tricalbin [Choiromyces venosus 120613-1]|uniref:Tricalbin n=1 Tax=Choiromyces venosus 120613-1 TaxID=1336337 RepID=A0A3N4JXL4_9PEZI|nr:tricalbin [Choiromyces venosus 120613-1]
MADRGVAPPKSAAEMEQEAKAREHELAKESRKGGAAVFEFDPNATPEQKAAQAKKAIPGELGMGKGKVTDITLALQNGASSVPRANLGTSGTNRVQALPDTPKTTKIPGMVNGQPKAGDGEWSRTGWEPRFGNLNDALGLDDAVAEDHQTLLESKLDDKFFGDWYHNAGVIGFACLTTWFLTLIGGGLGWVIIVMACCATYYRTSIRRVRRNIHDDLNREFAKSRLDTDVESLEWLNSFTVKFWPIYQPVLAATIINVVDQVLEGATPGFLDSLRLTTFTLGTKPPRIEFVKSYPKTEDDIIEMDWKFSFTPNDTSDLTSRQLRNKVNPKVVLEVRIGKGLASKGVPIVVEDMAFSGVMKVKIKLQIAFPHIEKVDVCFLGKPTFDYVLKPLGGETFGIDIGFLPGLNGFIQEMIHANLGPMFYAPNVFTVEVAKMLGGAPIDTAIGVLAVTIHNAQGLKNPDKFSGTPDPYTIFSINNREEVGRTKIVKENANPKWNETKYILINSYNDSLTMSVYDWNEFRKDKELGVATFALDKLKEDPEHENVAIPVMVNGKARGQISCDFRFFPVLQSKVLEDGTKEPAPESNTGILRFTVSQAKDLDSSKSLVGYLSPYAIQTLNGRTINKTKPVKRNNNPIWEISKEVLVSNRRNARLGLQIKDDRDLATDPLLGSYTIKLDDFIDKNANGMEWFNLSDAKTGKVKMTAQWKPVSIKGVLGGTGGYITPIGVMRVHLQSARDLRNLEALGKSDPYVHILLSGVEKARTVTFNSDLNPDWDEVLYVPVHSPRERLTLEVMDQENMGKDRSLGHLDVNCDEYIKQGGDGLWLEHSEKINRSEGLRLDRGVKGTLNFTVAFYPCLNIADPEEEEAERKSKEAEEKFEQTVEQKIEKTAIDVENEKSKAQIEENTLAEAAAGSESDEEKAPKIRLTPEELVRYDSGLLIFKIIDGQLAHKDCYLEVLMDDMLFPAYSTARIKNKNVRFDEIGDAFVRELEFSKVTLRLREHGKGGDQEDEILGKLPGSTLETVKQCLNNPTLLSLRGRDGEVSKVKISLKYIPVMMRLDPSESINNMGTLRVDVLDAANLPSADRNGKSDPFCVFTLDGRKLHQTDIQKKTLHPSWNEVFETKIASRTAANFVVDIFDWDFGSKADFLGKGQIDLKQLEPFAPKTVTIKLTGKQGQEGRFGELRLRLLFKSDYVTRSRQGSSTFHGTFATPGKIVTGVAGAPLKVGGFAAGGITKGASFLKKGAFGRKAKDSNGVTEETDQEMQASSSSVSNGGAIKGSGEGGVAAYDPDGSQVALDGSEENLDPGQRTPGKRAGLSPSPSAAGNPHNRNRSVSSTLSVPGGAPGGADHGTATVRIVAASGFPANANVQLRFKTLDKGKELHKSKSVKSSTGELAWDESFTFNCTADQQFKVYAKDNHLLRGDEELGEGLFVVDDTGNGGDTVVPVGQGKVVLRTSFKSSETASNASPRHRRGLLKVRSHAS